MNKREAEKQGLYFTGHYDTKDFIKEITKQIRKDAKSLGYKIRLIMVSDYPSGNLYTSLYGDEEYFDYKYYVAEVQKQNNLLKNKEEILIVKRFEVDLTEKRLQKTLQAIKEAEDNSKLVNFDSIINLTT